MVLTRHLRNISRPNPIDRNDPSLKLWLPFYSQSPELTGSTIYSQDLNRHTCTVVGAIWNKTTFPGRWFDKTDDIITAPDATSIQNMWDGGGTFWCWLNATSDGENDSGRIVGKGTVWAVYVSGEAGGEVKVNFFYVFAGGDDGAWITTATAISTGVHTFFALTYNANSETNNPIMYYGTTSLTTLTVGSGITESVSPVGVRTTDAGGNMGIGNRESDTAVTWDGSFGDVGCYKGKILSVAELENIRSKTAWRYS